MNSLHRVYTYTLASTKPDRQVPGIYTSRIQLRMLCAIGTAVCLLLPFESSAQPTDAVRLSSAQIQQAFANVCDRARVQDTAGTTAVNPWFADGRMSSQWNNGKYAGEIRGRWHTQDDLRCVTITAGMPELENTTRCGPIYRLGAEYFSVSADGSVHGIHQLSSMQQAALTPCGK
ncbi:hypothetical protein F0M18_07550 [Pseudohalioglobus sediminis]|uniref:Uncharacterized protein n=1 Tax=Pseudohalioglobus sediminis TaxID=2606449 RepID=A0A5B0X1J3_9GAMM|nr:hypothetical protein [Pseudohalioglobus sediminis]KAA1192518.1 hypothetical protein F0M18_07550 [Pseudohalioglobus sediminis]